MAMENHPDKVGHLGEDIRKAAEEKFTQINIAYEKIKKQRNMNWINFNLQYTIFYSRLITVVLPIIFCKTLNSELCWKKFYLSRENPVCKN